MSSLTWPGVVIIVMTWASIDVVMWASIDDESGVAFIIVVGDMGSVDDMGCMAHQRGWHSHCCC